LCAYDHLLGEPALADAGLPLHEEEATAAGVGIVEAGEQVGKLAFSADERAPRRLADTGVLDGIEGRVLAEDRLLELAKSPGGLNSELVDQVTASVPVRLERLGLPVGPVERQHQLRPEPLAQGMLARERVELGHELSGFAQLQPRGEQLFDRSESQLLEAADLGLCPGLVGRVGKRRPAPERKRIPEHPCRLSWLAGRFLRLVDESFEVHGVGVCRVYRIARPMRGDRVRAELAPKSRDVTLDELRRGCGRTAAPELLDDPLAGDHLVAMHE
jgi:hypothetical protein